MKKRFTAVMMSVVLGVMSGAGAFAAEAPQVPEVISDEVQENEQELMDVLHKRLYNVVYQLDHLL